MKGSFQAMSKKQISSRTLAFFCQLEDQARKLQGFCISLMVFFYLLSILARLYTPPNSQESHVLLAKSPNLDRISSCARF